MRQSIHTDTTLPSSVTAFNKQGRYVGAPKLPQDKPDTIELLNRHHKTEEMCPNRAERIAYKNTFR